MIEPLGYSLLESADSTMGTRGGKFYPNENYRKVGHIFRALSKSVFDEWEERRSNSNSEILENPSSRMKELLAQVDTLQLHVDFEDGRRVGTSRISLEDYSDSLGEDNCELSIVVDKHETYEAFFG